MKSVLALGSILALANGVAGQSYTFTTLAGEPHHGSVDGLGTAARFYGVEGIAIDADGTLYVADLGNSTIRRITKEGNVTTLAGMAGVRGGIDGVGANALFYDPVGVALSREGDLYVADSNGHAIRKVTRAGVVTTVAGHYNRYGSVDGSASEASFRYPRGVTLDPAGNIYVADTGASTVRKISTSGEVTTLAGVDMAPGSNDGIGSAARFRSPEGLAVDAAGNLFVTDVQDHTIRKITPSGEVSTFAGAAGQSGDDDGVGSAARFFCPDNLCFDEGGVLWVNDSINSRIRKVTPSGVVTTVATLRANALTRDAAGNLYLSGDDRIRKMSPSGAVTIVAGPTGSYDSRNGVGRDARFESPAGLAVDRTGTVFVADRNSFSIRELTPDGTVSTLAGYLEWYGSQDGAGYLARFRSPGGMASDADGNLIVSDHRTIRRVTRGGVVTTLAGSEAEGGAVDGPAVSARFESLAGLALDGVGNIFVVDGGAHTVRKLSLQGIVSTVAGKPGETGRANGQGATARFNQPHGLAIDAIGNLFVADTNNGQIRKIDPDGMVTTFAGRDTQGAEDGPLNTARFKLPMGLAFDRQGNLYLTELVANTVRRIDRNGLVQTIGGSAQLPRGWVDGTGAAARFDGPNQITVDRFGHLYLSEEYNNVIRKGMVTGASNTLLAEQPKSQTVRSGGTAQFSVIATGVPPPLYQWERRRIGDTAFLPVTEGGTFAGAETATLTIAASALNMNGDLYRCVVENGVGAAVVSQNVTLTVIDVPVIQAQPVAQVAGVGGTANFSVTAACSKPMTFQWYFNGQPIAGARSRTYSVSPLEPADAGEYHVVITTSEIAISSDTAVLGLTANTQTSGAARVIGPDIVHQNGNIYDQVLLEGTAAAVKADLQQIVRISFVDLDGDIVQVEFSGAGTLSLSLADASGPAAPENYNQLVDYMKGHAVIVIAGADESTHLSVFSVGPITALNQSLFRGDVSYDGMADLAFISITSATGKCGSLRAGNATFFASRGLTGLHAPGLEFVGPVVIGDVLAFDQAEPVLVTGAAADVRIAGGDASQPNQHSVKVSGITRVQFVEGMDSHGRTLPAQQNKARFEQDGRDVTDEIVIAPPS